MVTCGATAGFSPETDLRYIWSYELTIQGSNSWMPEDLVQLMDYIQSDRLQPVIDTVLPLDQTAEGVRLLRDREVIGKIIIETIKKQLKIIIGLELTHTNQKIDGGI